MQGGGNVLACRGVVLRDRGHRLTGGGYWRSWTPWYLHVRVGGDLLSVRSHRDLWLLGQHVWGDSSGGLLPRVGQVGLRGGGCWLGSGGYLWVHHVRRPRHHLRMLRAHVALGGLEALGHLRTGLEAVLLGGLQGAGKRLLILGRAAMLGGHVTMWVTLLGLERGLSPGWGLVSLRQLLPTGWGVLGLLLLLGVARGGLNGHPGLGHKVGICCHLWGGDRVARWSHGWKRLVRRGGVTGNGGLDAINSGGGGPQRGGGGGYWSGLVARQSGLG